VKFVEINKKKYFCVIIICAIISNTLFAQEESYYYVDNIFHEIYKENKVKSYIAIDDEYENGKIIKSSSSNKCHFDKEGNLILEIESYSTNSLCNDSLFYEYDTDHRHKRFSWYSKCPPQIEITTYNYNEEGKLVRYCDFSSKEPQTLAELDSCVIINYQNGKMIYETKTTGERMNQFIHKGGKVLVKSNKGELNSVYENENHVETYYPKEVYYRKYNSKHQLLSAKKMDRKGNLIQWTKYEYLNDLLIKSITYDNKDEILSAIRFEYTYFN